MNSRNGFFALLAIGGFVAWRNRYQIQRFLESQGVSLPINTSSISDAVQSTVAKVSGQTERLAKDVSRAS